MAQCGQEKWTMSWASLLILKGWTDSASFQRGDLHSAAHAYLFGMRKAAFEPCIPASRSGGL
jgi:hypothetical protein